MVVFLDLSAPPRKLSALLPGALGVETFLLAPTASGSGAEALLRANAAVASALGRHHCRLKESFDCPKTLPNCFSSVGHVSPIPWKSDGVWWDHGSMTQY